MKDEEGVAETRLRLDSKGRQENIGSGKIYGYLNARNIGFYKISAPDKKG